MTEHRPREIQLTSKQLVFVFMSTVLAAVVVFLLGVWVGRGIDTGSLAATDDVVGKSQQPAASPAGSEPAPPRLSYPEALTGKSEPGAAQSSTPPQSPADQPASAAPSPSTPPPSSAPPPEPPQEKQPAAASKAPANDDERVVQIGSYSAKAGADQVAAKYRGKGYTVTVTPGPKFRVWLGPYPNKAAADQIAARLRKEGQESSVIKPR